MSCDPLASAVFDPATVHLMGCVFDEAWARVAPDYCHLKPRSIEAVRVALASAVLCYARLGIRDPMVLRAMALGVIKRPAHV